MPPRLLRFSLLMLALTIAGAATILLIARDSMKGYTLWRTGNVVVSSEFCSIIITRLEYPLEGIPQGLTRARHPWSKPLKFEFPPVAVTPTSIVLPTWLLLCLHVTVVFFIWLWRMTRKGHSTPLTG